MIGSKPEPPMAEVTIEAERVRKRNATIGLVIGGLLLGTILYLAFFKEKGCTKNQDCDHLVTGQICITGVCQSPAPLPPDPMIERFNKGIMGVGDKLTSAESAASGKRLRLYSPDQTSFPEQQSDGKLVLYRNSTFVWSSIADSLEDGIYDTFYREDGELYTYNSAGNRIWSSKQWTTITHNPALTAHHLLLENGATLCSTSAEGGTAIWCRNPTPIP